MVVANQVDKRPFNRGALANAAFKFIHQGSTQWLSKQPTYMAVQDVDRFPDISNASCANAASQYYAPPLTAPRVLHPKSYAGGVLVVGTAHFRAVNGFSNEFWGWGHEDTELYLRLRWCGVPPVHAERLQWCMRHQDCEQCKKAKPGPKSDGTMSKTARIAQLLPRVHHSQHYLQRDGIRSLQFEASRNVLRYSNCGGHRLHVIDFNLDAAYNATQRHVGCAADGGARDNGCTSELDVAHLPKALHLAVARNLGEKDRRVKVLYARRSRIMYNFYYRLEVQVEGKNRQEMLVCELGWSSLAEARAASASPAVAPGKTSQAPHIYTFGHDEDFCAGQICEASLHGKPCVW